MTQRVKITSGFYAGRAGVLTDQQDRVCVSYSWVTLDPVAPGDKTLPVTVLTSQTAPEAAA